MNEFEREDLELAVELYGPELIGVLNCMLRTNNPLSHEVMLKPMLAECLSKARERRTSLVIDVKVA